MTVQLRQDWSRRSRCIDGRPGENGCAKTGGLRAARGVGARGASPVSYTHLTLPTILLV